MYRALRRRVHRHLRRNYQMPQNLQKLEINLEDQSGEKLRVENKIIPAHRTLMNIRFQKNEQHLSHQLKKKGS